jgi:chromosomal replication initiation ATPase DnaA
MTALDKIAQRINEEFNVNIFKHTRSRNVVDARSVFCYIVRNEYNLSLHAIADYFIKNGKPYDHSTAVHSIKNFEIVRKYDKRVEQVVAAILKDTDQDAHTKYLLNEILEKADKATKTKTNRMLSTVYTSTLEQQKAVV